MAGLRGHDDRFGNLLDELLQIAAAQGVHSSNVEQQFKRANILLYLEIITRHLAEGLEIDQGELGNGVKLTFTHPVAEHLRMLSEAIADLDLGLVDDILQKSSVNSGSRLKARQREKDRVILEALLTYQRKQKIPSLRVAARKFCREIETKYRRRGEILRPSELLALYYRYKS